MFGCGLSEPSLLVRSLSQCAFLSARQTLLGTRLWPVGVFLDTSKHNKQKYGAKKSVKRRHVCFKQEPTAEEKLTRSTTNMRVSVQFNAEGPVHKAVDGDKGKGRSNAIGQLQFASCTILECETKCG